MQTSKTDQLFEKILPAFVKIVKPNVQKFNGNPLEYSKFKAAFNVEVDKREVYDATEKLKFLLDSVDGSAKSCLAKFMPGSNKYGRWAEFVEGKPKLSTWDSFANWLEKEAKISEFKQRWMPEKREWKRSDTSKVDKRKLADKSQSELFVGATGESVRTSYGTKRCPIHQSTNHTLCKCAEGVFFPPHQEMSCRTSRKRGSRVLLARCENNS